MVIVTLTCTGIGEENNDAIFFSEELAPTKSPEDIEFQQLNATALNVTWTPLTLFEAQGFPQYRVILTINTSSRRKRQSDSITIDTNNSFAVVTDLNKNTDYSAVVGVRTCTNTMTGTNTMQDFLEADPVVGTSI